MRQEVRQELANAMKTLPPKPLPMNPAYRNAFPTLQERLQAETHAASADTTPRSCNPAMGSGRAVPGRERAATDPTNAGPHREAATREIRESGAPGHQRELREIQREIEPALSGSHRALKDRGREPVAAELSVKPRTPERQTRQQEERHGAETRAASNNARGHSIDRSTRSLSGRQGGSNTTAAERLQLQRRSSQTVARDAGLDDDTAEYNDRFLTGYDKHRLLGRGACAVVWLAQPIGQKGYVAIKQVAKGSTGKKRSDAEAARKEIFFGSYFFHPGGEPKIPSSRCPGIAHIAKLLDYSETKRDIWMVMEYGGTCLTKMAYEIKGEFLRGERLYRVVHLPMLQAMKRDPAVLKGMLRQLLSALCVLSEHHIVHSDIKPDNILIEEDERHQLRCRFIDLGSAFTFDCPENLALATPEYMPPEALEICAAKCGGGPRMSMGGSRSGVSGSFNSNSRKSADPVAKLQRHSQPWSFDIWSLGSILLELCLGTPLWLSYKCRVADDQRANSAATGLFAVPGRDPDKIISKQADALRQRGLANVLRNAQGVPINNVDVGSGLELLSMMLNWDPIDRISPEEALEHPWLQEYDT